MTFWSFPLISLGLGYLLVGALWAFKSAQPRLPAIFGAAASFACFLRAAFEVSAAGHERLFDPWLKFFEADALDAVPMAFFAVLTLGVLILMPRRDATRKALAGMLILAAATQTAYAAANLAVLAPGWSLTSLPFVFRMFGLANFSFFVQTCTLRLIEPLISAPGLVWPWLNFYRKFSCNSN